MDFILPNREKKRTGKTDKKRSRTHATYRLLKTQTKKNRQIQDEENIK